MSSTLPTTRFPAPIANSVSVAAGVSETILCGSDGIRTCVPSSSVTVTGKAGAGVGGGAGAVAVSAGTVEVVASGGAVGTTADAAAAGEDRQEEHDEENGKPGVDGAGRAAGARTERRSHGMGLRPKGEDRHRSRDDGDGCGQSVGCIVEPASLSKVVHHRGSATGLPSLGDGSP